MCLNLNNKYLHLSLRTKPKQAIRRSKHLKIFLSHSCHNNYAYLKIICTQTHITQKQTSLSLKGRQQLYNKILTSQLYVFHSWLAIIMLFPEQLNHLQRSLAPKTLRRHSLPVIVAACMILNGKLCKHKRKNT